MKQVNIHQAKTDLSKLVERAEAGEEIVIARAGKPAAKLIPLKKARGRRRLGLLDGKFKIPDDFNAPLPEAVTRLFEGRKRRDCCWTRICFFGRRRTANACRARPGNFWKTRRTKSITAQRASGRSQSRAPSDARIFASILRPCNQCCLTWTSSSCR